MDEQTFAAALAQLKGVAADAQAAPGAPGAPAPGHARFSAPAAPAPKPPAAIGDPNAPKVSDGKAAPPWVDKEKLAAATAAAEAKDQALIDELQTPPADPSAYKIPRDLPDGQTVPVEQIPALQAAAHDAGLTTGEFAAITQTIALMGVELGTQRDKAIMRKRADAMSAELDKRYGQARADELCELAVDTCERAKQHSPQIAEALRQAIVINRPLLELLARIGERNKTRKG